MSEITSSGHSYYKCDDGHEMIQYFINTVPVIKPCLVCGKTSMLIEVEKMKNIKEMKEVIRKLVEKYPLISDIELGRKLSITPLFLRKLLDEMILEEILTEEDEGTNKKR